MPGPVKLQFCKGKDALAAQMRTWARIGNLRRIIVSHGDVIEAQPQVVMLRLADSLD